METQGTVTPTAIDVIASTVATEATPTAEVKVESALDSEKIAEPTKEEDSFSKKFAALSKREKELQRKDEEMKARNSGYASVDEYKKLAKTNVHEFLEKSNLTFDEITDYYLNGATNKDPKLMEVEDKLTKLEASLREKEEKVQEIERQAAVSDYKAKQKEHVLSKPNDYELIAATDSYELVYDVTKQYYDKNNKVLTHDEAAKMVEDYLEKEVEKVLKASKIRNKFATQADNKNETSAKTEIARDTIKTLNNSMTGATGSPSSKILSREQSLERAASLLKFT